MKKDPDWTPAEEEEFRRLERKRQAANDAIVERENEKRRKAVAQAIRDFADRYEADAIGNSEGVELCEDNCGPPSLRCSISSFTPERLKRYCIVDQNH